MILRPERDAIDSVLHSFEASGARIAMTRIWPRADKKLWRFFLEIRDQSAKIRREEIVFLGVSEGEEGRRGRRREKVAVFSHIDELDVPARNYPYDLDQCHLAVIICKQDCAKSVVPSLRGPLYKAMLLCQTGLYETETVFGETPHCAHYNYTIT